MYKLLYLLHYVYYLGRNIFCQNKIYLLLLYFFNDQIITEPWAVLIRVKQNLAQQFTTTTTDI